MVQQRVLHTTVHRFQEENLHSQNSTSNQNPILDNSGILIKFAFVHVLIPVRDFRRSNSVSCDSSASTPSSGFSSTFGSSQSTSAELKSAGGLVFEETSSCSSGILCVSSFSSPSDKSDLVVSAETESFKLAI